MQHYSFAGKNHRVAKVLLSALLCFSMMPSVAFAAEGETANTESSTEVADEVSTISDSSSFETDVPAETLDTSEASAPTVMPEITDATSEVAKSEQDDTAALSVEPVAGKPEETQETVAESSGADSRNTTEEKPALGFVYIDEAQINEGEAQNIVAALSDEGIELKSATMHLMTSEGAKAVDASVIEGNGARFEIENLAAGEYELTMFGYSLADGVAFEEDLRGDGYCFEVLASEPSSIEVNALSLDADGSLENVEEAEQVIEEALKSAPVMAGSAVAPMARARAASTRAVSVPGLVVALDPGHGGSDPGASGNGLVEKDVNLKIAKYCQAALQRAGVSVFMTRSNDTSVELSERVEKAAKAGATVFVSLHINSSSPTGKGCEVLIPNDSSYNHDIHVAGKALGQKIIDKLADLGLKNRGLKVRNSQEAEYADGSTADYYAVIRGARKRGIPGIIVEHAFVSDKGDAIYMKSDANLKKLGEADAQGIIEAINQGIIKGKGGLVKTSKGYQYKKADGTYAKNSWVTVGNKRYYFGSDGYAFTWGHWIGGKYYYFNGSGQMHTGWLTWNDDSSRSYFGSDGAAVTGWQSISGKRYYFNPSTGRSLRWNQRIDGKFYYFNGDSSARTGWLTWNDDSSRSYFGSDGAAVTGWQSISGKRYYFNPSTGRSLRWNQRIDGKFYYFNGDSSARTGWLTWNDDSSRSYFGSDGAAVTGWQSISGKRYYFNPSTGRSLRWGHSIDGLSYYFNSDSTMHTGWLTWKADGSKSYFGPDGAMLTGQATVDGTLYDFGSDGKVRNRIMGAPRATVAAMVKDYNTQVARIGKSYPSAVYATKGAPTIESFCRTLYNEAVYEGVAPEVLYAQAMLETGLLQFGGDVKAEQCNFGGLGATGNGNPGNVFPDVATGLRAQVQHLKAYGSKEPLKGECVDVRFGYVNRGCAPYVADLAGKWASDKKYGIKLNQIIDRVCG